MNNDQPIVAEEIVDQTSELDPKAIAKAQALIQEQRDKLERHYAEMKKELKTRSKNELIKLVGACLIDNYVLKTQLEQVLQGANDAKVIHGPNSVGDAATATPGEQGPSEAERTSTAKQQ